MIGKVDKMRKSRIFRITARLTLLFVIFGFFQPVACGFSGPEIAKLSFKYGSSGLVFSIIMVLLALLLSLIAVLRIRKVGEKEIIATPLIIAVLLGLSYLMAKAELKDLLSLISFDRGSIMIGLGIILSLVSGILYAIIHRKEGADDEGSS